MSDAAVELALEHVRGTGLLDDLGACLALVSGGRDSTCLLDVLVTLLGRERVSALHVNYGLRDDAADGDEAHVLALCERLGVSASVERAPSPPPTGNLQAWARALRYDTAQRLAGPAGALVATGHTASDQAETILYRLAASPGRRALLGMRPRDGQLIRPLIALTRDQTTAYCDARGLDWREDASNADSRFARGRVRHGLLPALRAIHPAAELNVLRSAALLRDEADVLDRLLDQLIGGRTAISLAELRGLEPPLTRLVLVRMAEAAGASYLPTVAGRLADFEALATAGGSATLDVGEGVRAVVEYGALRFERPSEQPMAREVALPVPGSASFGTWTLTTELHTATERGALAKRVQDGSIAVLDADQVNLQALQVRGWRPGDAIRPIGLNGSKKSLADLFTDRRVPRNKRASLPLVICDNEVIWVTSLATAHSARVTARTRRIALITALPHTQPS